MESAKALRAIQRTHLEAMEKTTAIAQPVLRLINVFASFFELAIASQHVQTIKGSILLSAMFILLLGLGKFRWAIIVWSLSGTSP